MVDVTDRPETTREAIARASVRMLPQTVRLIETNQVAKGSVLEVAKIAGIMAAKQTPQIIPLCHPLPMTQVGSGVDRRTFSVLHDMARNEKIERVQHKCPLKRARTAPSPPALL